MSRVGVNEEGLQQKNLQQNAEPVFADPLLTNKEEQNHGPVEDPLIKVRKINRVITQRTTQTSKLLTDNTINLEKFARPDYVDRKVYDAPTVQRVLDDQKQRKIIEEFKTLYDTVTIFRKQMESDGILDEYEKEDRLFNIIQPYMEMLADYKAFADRIHFGRRNKRIKAELERLDSVIQSRKNRNENKQGKSLNLIRERAMELRDKERVTTDLKITANRHGQIEDKRIKEAVSEADRLIIRRACDGRVESGMIEQFLSMTERQRLLAYYLIENKRTDAPEEADVAASQFGDYCPDVEVLQSRLRSRKIYFRGWHNNGVHTRWEVLGSAMRVARSNGETIDAYTEMKEETQKEEITGEKMEEVLDDLNPSVEDIMAVRHAVIMPFYVSAIRYRQKLVEVENAGISTRSQKKEELHECFSDMMEKYSRMIDVEKILETGNENKVLEELSNKAKGHVTKRVSTGKQVFMEAVSLSKQTAPNISIATSILSPLSKIKLLDLSAHASGNISMSIGALSTVSGITAILGVAGNALSLLKEYRDIGGSELTKMDHLENFSSAANSLAALGKATTGAVKAFSKGSLFASASLGMTYVGTVTSVVSTTVSGIQQFRRNAHAENAAQLMSERYELYSKDEALYQQNLSKLQLRANHRKNVGAAVNAISTTLNVGAAAFTVMQLPVLSAILSIGAAGVSLVNIASQAIMKRNENKQNLWEFTGMDDLVKKICNEKKIPEEKRDAYYPKVERELLSQLGFESKGAFLGYMTKNYASYIFSKLKGGDESERQTFSEVARGFGIKVKYEKKDGETVLKHPSSVATIVYKMSK